jgi:hypothetical protein
MATRFLSCDAVRFSDGEGFNIQLDGLAPLDGRISIRVASEKKD